MTDVNEELDKRLFELLRDAIPPASQTYTAASAESSAAAIRREIQRLQEVRHELPTWVVPPGVHVDPSVPANVVESALADGYVYVIPPQGPEPEGPWWTW